MTVHQNLIVLAVYIIDLRQSLIDEEHLHAVSGNIGEGRGKGLQISQGRKFIHQEQALMLVNRLRSTALVCTDFLCMMFDHHFKEEPEYRCKAQQIGRRCHQIKRYGTLVIHQVIDTEVADGRIACKRRIKVLLEGGIRGGNDAAAFIVRLCGNLAEVLTDNRVHIGGIVQRGSQRVHVSHILWRISATDVTALLMIPLTNFNAIVGDMLEIHHILKGFHESLDLEFLHFLSTFGGIVIGIAVRINPFIDRIPFIIDHPYGIGLHEGRNIIECRRVRIMLRISKVRIFEMQDDGRYDNGRIASPMIEFPFSFIVCQRVGKILRSRHFFRRADRNLVKWIPACCTPICRRWFKFDDSMPHALTKTRSNAPVFGFDVIDDDRGLPTTKKRRNNESDAFAAACGGNDGKMFVGVVAQVEMCNFGMKFHDPLVEGYERINRE